MTAESIIEWCKRHNIFYTSQTCYDDMVYGDGNYIEIGMESNYWQLYDGRTNLVLD